MGDNGGIYSLAGFAYQIKVFVLYEGLTIFITSYCCCEMCFPGSGCSIKKNVFRMLKKSKSSKIPNLSFIYRRLKMIIKLFESLYIRKVRNTYLYLSSTVIP